MLKGREMREGEHLPEIKSLQRMIESEMQNYQGGFGRIKFPNIGTTGKDKVLERGVITSRTKLELLVLEYQRSKSTTKGSSQKLLRFQRERAELSDNIDLYYFRLVYSTRELEEMR